MRPTLFAAKSSPILVDMTGLLIYTPQITQRVAYIFQLFFDSLIRTPYSITTDEAVFNAYTGPKLNYSVTSISDAKVHIVPGGLLTEKGIKAQTPEVFVWNNLKVFYGTTSGSLPFDIFSASFYLVSRYEEYFPSKLDRHKRFQYKNCIAHKNNFLDEPLVNMWAEELKKIILKEYPAVVFSLNKYSFIPTIDIDTAYAHLGRNIFITAGAYLKALYTLDFKAILEKTLVLLRLKKDPYNTYHYQGAIFAKYHLFPIYFLLAGKRGHYDKNISPRSLRFKRLVKQLRLIGKIGIHPSYHSNKHIEIVEKEIKNVERYNSEKITCSRQHYLRLSLPETYRCLAKIGITDDYSMAYAPAVGFRASICTPFYFYDLRTESVLPVKVHSSSIMDGTLKEYLHLSPNRSIIIIKELIQKTKLLNGEFIPIWHNHSINDKGGWKDWKTIFETMMEVGSDKKI